MLFAYDIRRNCDDLQHLLFITDKPFGKLTRASETSTYRFDVPWTHAPTQEDPNCLTYTYHSAVDVRKDTNSGLIGPLLVCKPGALDENNKQV